MSAPYIILVVIIAVAVLLTMVLKFRLNAFLSLLITSILVGILTGMPLTAITTSIQNGMGDTLGFIATVVGLGAIFGQMLETSGGAKSLSRYLLKKFGRNKATWALTLSGFIIGIPVFLDVGFIILIPVIQNVPYYIMLFRSLPVLQSPIPWYHLLPGQQLLPR
jgi:Gnt-I system low-affinity gluconate transporter